MRMKKYLTMVLAIAISGIFVGCHEEEISGSLIEQKKIAFEEAFITAFGQPDPTHNWGFLTPSTATNDITRVADPRGNMWADEGWNVPPVITPEQKDLARRYFQQNTPLGYKDPGWSDFWIQQVYKGGTKVTNDSKTTEAYKVGNDAVVVGGNQMDHLASRDANEKIDHNNDFNNSDNNDWEGRMLMRNSSTYSFGYINSNATAIHFDKAALVHWTDIRTWAVDNKICTYDEATAILDDGWNRSYMGFDWEQLSIEDCYSSQTFTFENKTYHFLIANTNQYSYDETEPTYHGKKVFSDVKEVTDAVKRDLLSKGYLPYNDTMTGWIKVSTGADGYYSDWIVTLTRATNSAEMPKVRKVSENSSGYYRIYQEVLESGRVMCEDLAGASDNLDDLDYNDVVFDAISVHEYMRPTDAQGNPTGNSYGDRYYVIVRLMAAGGTIPATLEVEGHTFNIHSVLKDPTTGYIMINTLPNTEEARKAVNMAQVMSADPVTLSYKDEDGNTIEKFYSENDEQIYLENIKIDVLYDNVSSELSNKYGAAPLKFLTPLGTAWAKERKRIDYAYPGFPDWVHDKTKEYVWENNNVPEVDTEENELLADNLEGLNEADITLVSGVIQGGSSSSTKETVDASQSTMTYPSPTDETLFSFAASTPPSPGFLCPQVGSQPEEKVEVSIPVAEQANLEVGKSIRIYGVNIPGWYVTTDITGNTEYTQFDGTGNFIEIPLTNDMINIIKRNSGITIRGKHFTVTYVTIHSNSSDNGGGNGGSGESIVIMSNNRVTFGDYGAATGTTDYNTSFDFNDLSNSPSFEVEFTRNKPSEHQPDVWELYIRTIDSSIIVQASSSDGGSDADGKDHTSKAGTKFREVMTVPNSFMSEWRKQYVDWGKKGIKLDGKNITITKVTLHP